MSDKFDSEHASVSGEAVHRSQFAYVGDPNDKSTWKLPIHDASHVRNALARYNQTDLPASAKESAWRKILAAAKKFGIEVSDDTKRNSNIETGNSETNFEFRVSSFGLSEVKSGLVKIAIAYSGEFARDGKDFAITDADLESMSSNLAKREVPVDYEHLSGDKVPPGWSRAAGWIRRPAGIDDFRLIPQSGSDSGDRKSAIGN